MGSYAIGCMCAGYYLVRALCRKDLRLLGSGSVGGTNAARQLGRWALPVVGSLDVAKGALVTAVALRHGADTTLVSAVALAVVVGHVYPVQLRFRGGRGIAPSAGALLVTDPVLLALLAAAAAVAAVLTSSRIVAAIAAYALLPLIAVVLNRQPATIMGTALISLVVAGAHLRRPRSVAP